MFEYIACSEKGNRGENNEDRVLVNNTVISEGVLSGKKDDEFIAVVCDGVGRTYGGEVAAGIVASGFKNYNVSAASVLSLSHHIQSINNCVRYEQKLTTKHSIMASTAAGILFWKNRYMIFNLGDTRIYEVKEDGIAQKTKDHTLAGEKARWFTDSSGKANHTLTGYFGGYGHACNPSIVRGEIQESERIFLLCSDGVYKRIPEEKLKMALMKHSSLMQKKRAILDLSIQNGSSDDKSLVLIRYRK